MLSDSGAERVLAAPGVARQIGVTPDRDDPTPLKIGGETRLVHPAVGFFDQFTVTFSRSALQLAVEGTREFDRRYSTH
jgi:hypothetical protein